jgi:hypothetical protein
LGKTIDSWVQVSRRFTKGGDWDSLNVHHAKVHSLGNDLITYLQSNNNKVDGKVIDILGSIETETKHVFVGLDNVKKNND